MKVVCASSEAIFLDVMCDTCSQCGFTVAGRAQDGMLAAKLVYDLKPSALLVDLDLQKLDGFSVMDLSRFQVPSLVCVAIASRCSQYIVTKATQVGLSGFIDKATMSLSQFKDALRIIASKGSYFSGAYEAAVARVKRQPNLLNKILSSTEEKVLSLICRGLDDYEIGTFLGVAECTARSHRRNIMRKIGIRKTSKLIAYSIGHGLVPDQIATAEA